MFGPNQTSDNPNYLHVKKKCFQYIKVLATTFCFDALRYLKKYFFSGLPVTSPTH